MKSVAAVRDTHLPIAVRGILSKLPFRALKKYEAIFMKVKVVSAKPQNYLLYKVISKYYEEYDRYFNCLILGETSVDRFSRVQEESITGHASFNSPYKFATSSQISITDKSEKIIKHRIIPPGESNLKEKLHGLNEKVDFTGRKMNLLLGRYIIVA